MQFIETKFPFADIHSSDSTSIRPAELTSLLGLIPISSTPTQPDISSNIPSASAPISSPSTSAQAQPPSQAEPNTIHSQAEPSNVSSQPMLNIQTTFSPATPFISTQQTKVPASTHHMITRTRDNTRKPCTYPNHVAFTATVATEPTTFSQAQSQLCWQEAMQTEINALLKNQTWTLVPPPSNQKVISCKWVYKIKRKADGTIERYKARLVAKGFHQADGVDYFKIFSPVVRPTTVRLVLSIAITYNWSIR